MTIPLLDIFEKIKARFVSPRSASGPLPLPTPVDKPDSDKFAKTVLPNSVQTIAPETTAPPAPAAMGRRVVAMGRAPVRQPGDLPPAVALALEPRIERVLSLALDDVIIQVPDGYLKPRESFDTARRVLLKAAEIEKGMATGRPTISIASLYQQVPEIFMHTVPSSDASLVALPFEKVMSELSSLRVRNDQTSEQVVPQVETPFLQVTVEDTQRFGLPFEPITTAELPPMRLEPATARTIAAAEPEPTARERFVPSSIPNLRPAAVPKDVPSSKLPPPTEPPVGQPNGEQPNGAAPAPATRRIPFAADPGGAGAQEKFGTGEPAFPRVPASSGPPVPPSSLPKPARIPFTVPAEPNAPMASASSEEAPLDEGRSEENATQPMLMLPLRPILQSLPPMQLAGDPGSVPPDAKISFRMAMIAPQLVTGKVAINPSDFHAALPEAFRNLFLAGAIEAPVQLSLPDVLANLPGEALRLRQDQEFVGAEEIFETPFSTKAAEDAKRFATKEEVKTEGKKPDMPGDEVLAREQVPTETAASHETPAKSKADSPSKFDAKEAVVKACALAAVESCSVIFADGLSIAGNIPGEMHIEGLSAVAPTLLQKLGKHMLETPLGPLTCLTVHGEKSPVSFFAAGNICLTAVHGAKGLSADTRRELASITQELSRTYSQPETPDVHN